MGTLVLFYTDAERNGAEVFKTEGDSLFDCLKSLKKELVLTYETRVETADLKEGMPFDTEEEAAYRKVLESAF